MMRRVISRADWRRFALFDAATADIYFAALMGDD